MEVGRAWTGEYASALAGSYELRQSTDDRHAGLYHRAGERITLERCERAFAKVRPARRQQRDPRMAFGGRPGTVACPHSDAPDDFPSGREQLIDQRVQTRGRVFPDRSATAALRYRAVWSS